MLSQLPSGPVEPPYL
ncbi:hypothetical protein AYI69_g8805, partial [Smittium culicis]